MQLTLIIDVQPAATHEEILRDISRSFYTFGYRTRRGTITEATSGDEQLIDHDGDISIGRWKIK